MKTLVLGFLLSLSTFSLFAVQEVSLTAISGYDAVSYFTKNKAVRGDGQHSTVYKGETYLFSSKENKNKFISNPSKYMPQFGGYCAYGAAFGKKFHTSPEVFAIVDGKLYLNLNKDIQKKWDAKRAALIKDAHTKWPKIKSTPVSNL